MLDRDKDTGNKEDNQVMAKDGFQNLKKYVIRVHYLKVGQSKCFDWTSIFIVGLPVYEHNPPEVIVSVIIEIFFVGFAGVRHEIEVFVEQAELVFCELVIS